MNIQFETSSLTPDEVLGLIAFLENLLPDYDEDQIPVNSESNTTPRTSIASVPSGTTEAPTPGTRKRRTKAEIAADEAAAKQAQLGQQMAELQGADPAAMVESLTKVKEVVQQVMQATPAPTPTTSTTLSVPSPDDLRSLLNAFIAKHSMEDAIAVLKSFNCNRVTEALALEPAKLMELAAALNG